MILNHCPFLQLVLLPFMLLLLINICNMEPGNSIDAALAPLSYQSSEQLSFKHEN